MSLLDGFQKNLGMSEQPFITLTNTSITFSKYSGDCLGMPAYVHLYTNAEKRQIAITPAEADADSLPFYRKPDPGKSVLLRWTNKSLAQSLIAMTGITDDKVSIRISGQYYPEENVIIYDLSKQMPAAVKKHTR